MFKRDRLESLAGSTNLTVFAPNNTAVKNYGYANLEAIEKTDPEVLKAWLSYHIAKDRKFAQDYF
ncbi:fasciclin domain-containing protein, partial [Sphingobacterium daejeonense]|uniref:fasciclin domain-containing protein n=1 Tax=Sphingobacterium daejeonense TaxID=371142 RepID=UPI003D3236F8